MLGMTKNLQQVGLMARKEDNVSAMPASPTIPVVQTAMKARRRDTILHGKLQHTMQTAAKTAPEAPSDLNSTSDDAFTQNIARSVGGLSLQDENIADQETDTSSICRSPDWNDLSGRKRKKERMEAKRSRQSDKENAGAASKPDTRIKHKLSKRPPDSSARFLNRIWMAEGSGSDPVVPASRIMAPSAPNPEALSGRRSRRGSFDFGIKDLIHSSSVIPSSWRTSSMSRKSAPGPVDIRPFHEKTPSCNSFSLQSRLATVNDGFIGGLKLRQAEEGSIRESSKRTEATNSVLGKGGNILPLSSVGLDIPLAGSSGECKRPCSPTSQYFALHAGRSGNTNNKIEGNQQPKPDLIAYLEASTMERQKPSSIHQVPMENLKSGHWTLTCNGENMGQPSTWNTKSKESRGRRLSIDRLAKRASGGREETASISVPRSLSQDHTMTQKRDTIQADCARALVMLQKDHTNAQAVEEAANRQLSVQIGFNDLHAVASTTPARSPERIGVEPDNSLSSTQSYMTRSGRLQSPEFTSSADSILSGTAKVDNKSCVTGVPVPHQHAEAFAQRLYPLSETSAPDSTHKHRIKYRSVSKNLHCTTATDSSDEYSSSDELSDVTTPYASRPCSQKNSKLLTEEPGLEKPESKLPPSNCSILETSKAPSLITGVTSANAWCQESKQFVMTAIEKSLDTPLCEGKYTKADDGSHTTHSQHLQDARLNMLRDKSQFAVTDFPPATNISQRHGELEPTAKMFVVCCSCKYFHDMPSKLYECMLKPDGVVKDTNLGVSGIISTSVKCPWCSHAMSTSCCAGYAAVVYLRERFH